MKKVKVLLALVSLVVFAGFQIHAESRSKNTARTQVRAQLAALLQEHQNFLQTAYSAGDNTGFRKMNAAYGDFEKSFYTNVSFFHDAQIQNFLRNVEYSIEHSGRPGYTMMSYTSYIMTGGQTHSVQYTYQSNGKDITLVKQTNNNGKLLKSVYSYDINTRSLQADDFMENRKIHEKVYKI